MSNLLSCENKECVFRCKLVSIVPLLERCFQSWIYHLEYHWNQSILCMELMCSDGNCTSRPERQILWVLFQHYYAPSNSNETYNLKVMLQIIIKVFLWYLSSGVISTWHNIRTHNWHGSKDYCLYRHGETSTQINLLFVCFFFLFCIDINLLRYFLKFCEGKMLQWHYNCNFFCYRWKRNQMRPKPESLQLLRDAARIGWSRFYLRRSDRSGGRMVADVHHCPESNLHRSVATTSPPVQERRNLFKSPSNQRAAHTVSVPSHLASHGAGLRLLCPSPPRRIRAPPRHGRLEVGFVHNL
jgi:hypothetical protein